jgi:hypothetical protein
MECTKNDDDPWLQVYRLLTACITCINIKIVLKKIMNAESSERKSSARASIEKALNSDYHHCTE